MKSLIKRINNYDLNDRYFFYVHILIMLAFSLLPLLVTFPYRVNIFLTWEGAYRLADGQLPYKDFGLPLGIGFWLVPALFFKLFGPLMVSLLKAQALLNFLSFLAIRNLLKKLDVDGGKITLVLLLFGISFVLINFWPWYNHTVFVYQIIAVSILVSALLTKNYSKHILLLISAALFTTLSFFTKQDGGGFAIILTGIILLYDVVVTKRYLSFIIFYAALVLFFLLHILPFLSHDFGYWFNHGQFPHYSRVNSYDIIRLFFQESLMIKLYLIVVVVIIVQKIKLLGKEIFNDRIYVIFTLLTLGILGQVLVIQVTSFSPPTGVYYYHTFAWAYILSNINLDFNFKRPVILVPAILLVLVWYSADYWKYTNKIVEKFLPKAWVEKPSNVVSIGNWAPANADEDVKPIEWVFTNLKTLKKISIPSETFEGINKIKELSIVKDNPNLKVLNMTELTSLAYELGYQLPKGSKYPLWYHKGVCLFDREIDLFCDEVKSSKYDLILFERMDYVDNFFPYAVRDCALENYELIDEFEGPTGYGNVVEVYIRK